MGFITFSPRINDNGDRIIRTMIKVFNCKLSQQWLIDVQMYIQGGNQLVTKSTAQLWPHFESWWLFEPTGGSPDVVHLIINASEVSGWLLKASVGLQPKDTFGRR